MKKSKNVMKMFSANIRIGKLLLTAIVLMLSLGLLAFSAAAAEDVRVSINGSQIVFDVPPQIINGRTMVPMRAIFEALGAEIDWNSGTQTATAVKDNTVIIMQINNPTITVNGVQSTLDSPPVLVNSRTLVPVRAIAEGFGSDVQWDEKNRTVYITEEGVTSPTPTPTPTPTSTTPTSSNAKILQDYEKINPPTMSVTEVNDIIGFAPSFEKPEESSYTWTYPDGLTLSVVLKPSGAKRINPFKINDSNYGIFVDATINVNSIFMNRSILIGLTHDEVVSKIGAPGYVIATLYKDGSVYFNSTHLWVDTAGHAFVVSYHTDKLSYSSEFRLEDGWDPQG